MNQDTIAAIATAPGQGGVSIVRMSGPEAERVLMALFRPAKKSPPGGGQGSGPVSRRMRNFAEKPLAI